MTSTDICNMALSRIGEAPVSDISGTDTVSVLCTLHYAHTVQEVLRAHRWNFATKRTKLEPSWVTPTGIAESFDSEFEITKAAHGLTTGQRVTFHDSSNYPLINGTWPVTVASSSVFTLDDSTFSGSGTVDATYALAAVFGWAFSIAAPSDCLRALEDDRRESTAGVSWAYESGRVLTDAEELYLSYIEDVTTVSRFDPLFVEALILKLAVKFETALRGTSPQTANLAAEYLSITAPLARRIDANEGQTRERLFPMQSRFIRARFVGVNAIGCNDDCCE